MQATIFSIASPGYSLYGISTTTAIKMLITKIATSLIKSSGHGCSNTIAGQAFNNLLSTQISMMNKFN